MYHVFHHISLRSGFLLNLGGLIGPPLVSVNVYWDITVNKQFISFFPMYCTYTRPFVFSCISHYPLHNLTWRFLSSLSGLQWNQLKAILKFFLSFFFFFVNQLRELNQLKAVLHVTKKIKMHNFISLKCNNKYARLLTVAYTKNKWTR